MIGVARELRYNWRMTQLHRAQDQRPRSHLWLFLALAAVLIAAAVLWLRGTVLPGSSQSPVPTRSIHGASPISTPSASDVAADTEPASVAAPAAWTGAALAWVALGIVLALAIVLLVLRRHSPNR